VRRERRSSSVGEIPTRQLSLQPVAIGNDRSVSFADCYDAQPGGRLCACCCRSFRDREGQVMAGYVPSWPSRTRELKARRTAGYPPNSVLQGTVILELLQGAEPTQPRRTRFFVKCQECTEIGHLLVANTSIL
jgi:hypothetical protein